MECKCPFSYTVVVYIDHEDKFYRESGMSFAETWGEAAQILDTYYGKNLVSIKHLHLYEEEDSVIIGPEKAVLEYNPYSRNFAIPCDEKGDSLDEMPKDLTLAN